MKKRILSLLMALALCLSLLPTMALAGTEPNNAWKALGQALNSNDPSTVASESFNVTGDGSESNPYKITLQEDITAEVDNTTLTVSGTKVLDLNDHVINADGKLPTDTGSVITVPSGATLNLYDCGTTVRYYDKDETGLWTLKTEGTSDYTTTGGVITGGKASNGGGVYVNGTFNMNGGSIAGNEAGSNGGGVCAGTLSTFVMTDGMITGNTATGDGGGVYAATAECLAAGTPITLEDGTRKPIETLQIGDEVRAFDHETGTVITAKLFDLWKYPEQHAGAFTLHFTNGIDVTAVGGHCFFDKAANKYVAVTKENVKRYIDHQFYNLDAARWETLTGVDFLETAVDTYIIVTEKHLNCAANGMLSNEDGIYDILINLFAYGDNLKIDAEKKAADLEKYGIWGFENAQYMSEDFYDALNLQYMNVAFGKGMITPEMFAALVAYTVEIDPELICDTAAQQCVDEVGETCFVATAKSVQNALPGFPGVYLGGTAKITGNTGSNLYLTNSENITLGTGENGVAEPDDMLVGVTMQTPGAFTNNATNATPDDMHYFFSDSPVYSVTHIVSDDTGQLQLIKNWTALQGALNGTPEGAVPGLFEIEEDGTITLLTDFKADTNDTTLTVAGIKTLDLNGHVINADGKLPTDAGSVIKVPSDATLTLEDSNTDDLTHKFKDSNAITGLWVLDDTLEGDSIKRTVVGGVITGGTGKVRDDDLSRSDGGGIYVSGTLNMTGGSIVGNVAQTGNGGGVYVNKGATFNMTGKSTISGNTASNGAGVNSSGIFAMSGDSEITYNKGDCGGGVLSDGSFTMSGNSIIEYNEGTMWGGGVEVTNSGTFTMTGNSRITNNKGGRDGGVYIAKGTFTMTGGSIDHNTATSNNKAYGGGVLVDDYNKENIIIALGGTAKITDNVKTGGTVINLNLPTGKTVNLGTKTESSDGNGVAAPTGDFKVGVTTQTAPTDAAPVKITTNGALTDTNYFSSDSADYVVAFDTDHLELQVNPTPPAPTPPSGGSSTPTVNVPVSGNKDSVKVTATVSGGNVTVKNVTVEQLDKVGTGENVTIDLSSLSKSVSGVTIPKTTLENVAKSDADGLEVKLPNGTTAVFDRTTVAAVAEQAAGSNIQLVVDKENKAEQALTAAQKETVKALNGALVLDAYFVSNGKRISDFKGGEAELTVSYPTTKPVRVWYVAEDGSMELVPSTFDGKAAKFVVTHFSHYAIELLDGSSYAACPQDNTCVYAKFTDADTKAWYHDGVHFCVDNGYMQGVSANKFNPSGTLSRGMIVTMLWRMEGEPVVNYAMTFKDVPADKWYTEAIRWAQSTGVVDGYSADSFGPDDNVTREQLAAILYNYAVLKGVDTEKFTENTNTLSHNDVFTISDWATSGMHFCIAAGVVNGDNGMLYPQNTATRAEAASMMQRFCETVLEK